MSIKSRFKEKFQTNSSKWKLGLVVVAVAAVGTFMAVQSSAAVCKSTTYRQGSSGHCVKIIQKYTRTDGKYGYYGDGVFGPRTRSDVIAFQRSRGLAADGVVGLGTWRAICSRISPTYPYKAQTSVVNDYNAVGCP